MNNKLKQFGKSFVDRHWLAVTNRGSVTLAQKQERLPPACVQQEGNAELGLD